jgi:hypothetical protein
MYLNLEAEMKRYGVSRSDLAKCLNVRYGTILRHFSKGKFLFEEALIIRNRFFPQLEIEYLFAETSKDKDSVEGANCGQN